MELRLVSQYEIKVIQALALHHDNCKPLNLEGISAYYK
jgi:23S rRNA maturation-related 3'-5' exoribonuclease YhaM